MNAVSTKVLLQFFSSSLPICPIYIFLSDTYSDMVKIWMGQMGRLEEKIAAVLLY
jgi:hypothetical protein